MKKTVPLLWLIGGAIIGVFASQVLFRPGQSQAAGDSRFKDYIMCTGTVSSPPNRTPIDGLWILDYKAGKLLGTVISRTQGRVTGWAEVDLVREFGIQPRQDVHFLMTTGAITQGQNALYVAETTTGKLGVYTMGTQPTGTGIAIRRHDLVFFRSPAKQQQK